MKILLDTNVLLLPVQRKLDVFRECERLCEDKCEFLVLKQTVGELKSMAVRRSKEAIAARIALQMLLKNGARTVESSERKADKAVVELARDDNKIVFATNDAPLRRKLRALGAKVICLKGSSRLGWC